jgi:signal transduction histidine kinase
MLSDLLAYSRIDGQEIPAEPIGLGDVVAEVEANLRGRISDAGARIYTDALPSVRGDRTQLVQLLQNLIGNAITYVAPGVSPRVHVAAARVPDGWQVSVADNGIGIREGEREQAFRLFRRVGDPEAHPGNGLGLALCRRIVTRHGGRIWLDAAPGGGTTANFILPDEPSPPDELPVSEPAEDAPAP